MDNAGPNANTSARIRLRSLNVHAIALVPDGANLHRWADVRKNLPMSNTVAKVLSLPKTAQEQLAAGLTQVSEAVMALLDVVKTATVDEATTATVDPEFAKQIIQVGMMLSALGNQYAPQVEELAPESGMQLSPEEMALAKGAVAKGASWTAVTNAFGIMKRVDAVNKGRVKMSFDNAMKLQDGIRSQIYAIVEQLAPMLAEFGADGVSAALNAVAPNSEAKKSAPSAAPAGGGDAGENKLSVVEKALANLTATVDQIAKARNPSNAVPLDSAGGKPPEFRVPYGQNLSEEVRKAMHPSTNNPSA